MKNLSLAPRKGRVIDFEKAKKDKELELKKPVPDNTSLYKRTQLLFKKRRQSIDTYINKLTEGPSEPLPTTVTAPAHPPSQVLGKYISKNASNIYRPPPQALPDTQRVTKSRSKSKPATSSEPTSVSTETTWWPPPKDNNYFTSTRSKPLEVSHSTVSTTPRQIKASFVDCDKCGKKNLSSLHQLKIHQASKKCKNRQDRQVIHRCEICQAKFDTSHNLRKHICRNY